MQERTPPAKGMTARAAAVTALLRLEKGAYSNIVLEPLLQKAGLSARDRSFAEALFYTALERRVTADYILSPVCSRPLDQLDAPVRWVLRAGVTQLFWMDGVDDFAAVHESVELARELGFPKAAGMVNGVLRGVLRAGKQIPWKGTEDAAERMSIELSCPPWLVRMWTDAYGEKATRRLLEQSLLPAPLYLRANTLKVSAMRLSEMLRSDTVVCKPLEPEGCVAVSGPFVPGQGEAFREGLYHVQDRASQYCAALLDARPGQRVLDTCAAPGGKSFTLAQYMCDTGTLLARELHEKRTGLIRDGARRLGLTCVQTSAGDATQYDPSLGLFDRVLCDVPCSGLGVIRRRPEIKYKTPESIRKLPDLQYKILQTSSHYLKPGGLLVYSTCTLHPAENERVVERFLEEAQGFALLKMQSRTGEKEDSDGFFTALLHKKD